VTHLPYPFNDGWQMMDSFHATYMGVQIQVSFTYPCTAERAAQVRP
jgi:hypothetical protein